MQPNWASRNRYSVLLVAITFMLAVYPILRGPFDSLVMARVLITAVYLAGGWVILADNRRRFVGFVLAIPALLGVWMGYVMPSEDARTASIAFHVAAIIFQTFVLVILIRGVHREPIVSWDAVSAALCGYLLLGIIFGHAYCLLHDITPDSFVGLVSFSNEIEAHFRLTYFSFVTLTTVGYGDITPAKDTARSLSVVEAVIGQFYLAVLVADLVGKRVAQVLSNGSPPPN